MKIRFLLILLILISSTISSQPIFNIINDKEKTEDQILAELNQLFKKGRININELSTLIPRTTPLMDAASLGYSKIVNLLLVHGASINAENPNGSTALFYAATRGHINVVKMLLQKGANPKHVQKNGNSLLVEILRLYVNNLSNIKSDADKKIFKNNIYDIIALILDKGVDINKKDSAGATPIMLAAANRDWPVVRLLKDRGANIHEKDNLGRKLYQYIPTAKDDYFKSFSPSDKKFLEDLRRELEEASIKKMEEGWHEIKNPIEEGWTEIQQ